jgi:glutathione S-transferase
MTLVQPPRELHLYWFPGSCARVTLVALEEIGAPFRLTVPKRPSPDYDAVNPKGKVPALVADGRVITENPAIQIFLARSFPDARLLPEEPEAALDALSTMCWFSSGIHPAITRLRFPFSASPPPESHDAVREVARGLLEDAFAILERRLADREWLYGEWTIVDAYMLWCWFRAVGSGLDGSQFPRCADHGARCEQRPSVARALDREEAELARLLDAGAIPERLRAVPNQAGRLPVRQSG